MRKVDIKNDDVVEDVVAVLSSAGVVMHPTETCYGLAADIFSKQALDKLYRLKGMPADKPVSIMVDSLGMAQEYGVFSDKALALAQQHWPGPLSILLPRKKSLPAFLNSDSGFVSIRFSSMAFCRDMVRELGHPVTTTSANRFSEPELYLPLEINGVDLLVDGGDLNGNKPSTIVKVEGDFVEVIRQGDVLVD